MQGRKLPDGRFEGEGQAEDTLLLEKVCNAFGLPAGEEREVRAGLRQKLSQDPKEFLQGIKRLKQENPPRLAGVLLEMVGSAVSGRLWKALRKECEHAGIDFFQAVSRVKSPLLHGRTVEQEFEGYPERVRLLLTVMQELANFEEKTLWYYWKEKREEQYIIPPLERVSQDPPIFLNPETGGWAVVTDPSLLDPARYAGRGQMLQAEVQGTAYISEGVLTEQEKKDLDALVKARVAYHTGSNTPSLMEVRFRPTFLSIMLTEKCNFACEYCYQDHDPGKKEANARELDAQASRILSWFRTIKSIEFFGGEPLLELGKLRMLLLNELVRARDLFMETNGNLLTREVARLLKVHGVSVGVSLDGPPEKNRHRKTRAGEQAYETAVRAMENLKAEGHSYGMISVLTPSNAGMGEDFLEWAEELGVHSFHVNYCNHPELAPSAGQAFEFFKKTFEAYVEQEHYKRIGYSNFKWAIEALSTPQHQRSLMCGRSPCGAGIAHLTITPDARIAPCPRLSENRVSPENTSDLFRRFWSVYSHNILTTSPCSECAYRNLCTGACPETSSGKVFREYCRFQRMLWPWLMQKVYENPKYLEAVKRWKRLKVSPITPGP